MKLNLITIFFCRRCGCIYDIDVEGCPLVGKKMIDGHRIEEVRPYIVGICLECLKEEKANEEMGKQKRIV